MGAHGADPCAGAGGDAGLASDIEAVRRAVIAGNTDRDRIARDAARDARATGRGGSRGGHLDGQGWPRRHAGYRASGAGRRADRGGGGTLAGGAAEGGGGLRLDRGGDDAERLSRIHRLFSRVHQSGRLLTDEALDPETVGAGGRAFLSAQARLPDAAALAEALDAARAEAVGLVDKTLPPPTDTDDKEERDA
jgi:glutamate-ammonia-ligase adenylyltransferase